MSRAIGLDFGTTNTVIALGDEHGQASPVPFTEADEVHLALRSALCFWRHEDVARAPIEVEAGPWAIRRYIEHAGERRFMQSMKTFAASPYFKGTLVFAKRFAFEDLLAVYLERAIAHAGASLAKLPSSIVVGRPVRFAGAAPDEALAMERYRAALTRFGLMHVHFVYEPVAAALFFAQRLDRPATVLVADFGGGTTDYSLIRFERQGGRLVAEPLAQGGVGIAGDTFDYRIISNVILGHIGKGSRYRSMGKELDLPQSLFTNFARWNLLSVLKSSAEFRDLRRLQRHCVEPEKVQRFIDLVDGDQGYPLYKAVSDAKASLSFAETTVLRFPPLGDDFARTITRGDFEAWIAEDLARIEEALDETLVAGGVPAERIDHIFLTGGTSYVPAITTLFERRFGSNRVSTGDQLLSIANGLALIGERDDVEDWAVPQT
jgi:hypothetical chaperone protein